MNLEQGERPWRSQGPPGAGLPLGTLVAAGYSFPGMPFGLPLDCLLGWPIPGRATEGVSLDLPASSPPSLLSERWESLFLMKNN